MYSETPDIMPFTSPLRAELLEGWQVERLKAGTLQLLAEVGVRFPSPRALEVFSDHGAQVDWPQQIVRIPTDLVGSAMSSAPRAFTLAGREERFDLRLDGTCSYLCTDGTGVEVIDPETRARRPSCKADVALVARVCDALPLVGFYWPPVSAQDYGLTAPLHQCHAGLTNTLKHVRGAMTIAPSLAPYAVEMAQVVAGSAEALRQRPPICANICTIAPLAQDSDGIEAALVYAEASIPVSFMAMPTMGSTAPATPLGALVQGDAEVVAAMVLVQLVYPGAPVFHSIVSSLMDPRTGGYIGTLPLPLALMAVQLAHAWNVPSLGGGSLASDAPDIGWQSGTEAGLGAATIPLAGAEICGFLGLVRGSMVLYPEQVLLDYEICQNAYDLLRGFDWDEADMALDVIAKVGPGSHFLREKHTRQHIRDFRLSRLVRQKGQDGGLRDPRQVALEQFRQIAADHHPRPLPENVLVEWDRILDAAERQAERMAGGGASPH
ncbi:MAG: trimethylamine methyltransferase family protein [Anaerolineae bacterium]|nr:trimethylamine methyltransferase family protein [Anaerolineae bacterium]